MKNLLIGLGSGVVTVLACGWVREGYVSGGLEVLIIVSLCSIWFIVGAVIGREDA